MQKVFEQRRKLLEDVEVVLQEDDFSDDRTIKITKVASQDTEYFKLYEDQTGFSFKFLGFTFINHNGRVYIEFFSRNEDITLSKGDSLIFLFEDRSKIDFIFSSSGQGSKGFRYNTINIGFDELNAFLTKNLWKVKMVSKRKGLYCIYHMNHLISDNIDYLEYWDAQYLNKIEGQYLLRFLTAKFIEMNQDNKI